MNTTDKTREIRLRRTAQRQGLTLHKSRARDPLAIGHGLFHIADDENVAVAGYGLMGYEMSTDEVEVYLADAQDFDVYFENPHGDYWAGDKPILEWTGQGWHLSTRGDSPNDHLLGGARSDLAHVAIRARSLLGEWAN